MNNTAEIFDNKYADYIMRTINLNLSDQYSQFLKYVPEGGYIFDIGCGSGRDSFHFKNMGYKVMAIDGGKEFCRFASNLIEQPVKCMKFEDITFANEFDGVWAYASIHHLDKDDLVDVFKKLWKALKVNGVIFFTSRYGEREYDNKFGKHFNEFTEESFREFLKENLQGKFEMLEDYMTTDKREGRDEQWYCTILKKKEK